MLFLLASLELLASLLNILLYILLYCCTINTTVVVYPGVHYSSTAQYNILLLIVLLLLIVCGQIIFCSPRFILFCCWIHPIPNKLASIARRFADRASCHRGYDRIIIQIVVLWSTSSHFVKYYSQYVE